MTTNIPATTPLIERRVRPQLDRIAAGLTEARLLVSGPEKTMASLGHLLIGATLLVGVIKCMVGISRERPVSILLALLGVTLVGWIILSARRLHRTRAGDTVLANLRKKHSPTQPANDYDPAPTQMPNPAAGGPAPAYAPMMGFHPATMLMALYGPSILMGHPVLGHAYPTLSQGPMGTTGGTGDSSGSDAGSDSDSGDSGGDSSCSSGCGGCGGGGD